MVIALAFTLSITGSAANVPTAAKSQTENMTVSKSTTSSLTKSGTSKKAHKHHKNAASAKKAK